MNNSAWHFLKYFVWDPVLRISTIINLILQSKNVGLGEWTSVFPQSHSQEVVDLQFEPSFSDFSVLAF